MKNVRVKDWVKFCRFTIKRCVINVNFKQINVSFLKLNTFFGFDSKISLASLSVVWT